MTMMMMTKMKIMKMRMMKTQERKLIAKKTNQRMKEESEQSKRFMLKCQLVGKRSLR
jgi:hypothetical protein